MVELTLAGKRVLLIVTGGIAAYKSLEVIRRLRDRGAAVRCVLTKAGAEFVTPLSLAALSGDKAYGALFSLTDESEMGHIRLSREADLLLVAPASADFLAKLAGGHADDLASAVLLIAELLDGAALAEFVEAAHSVGLDALVEFHRPELLVAAVEAGSGIVGINNRNLDTMEIDTDHALRLSPALPNGLISVADSAIAGATDVA